MSEPVSLPIWADATWITLREQEKVWAKFQPMLEARGYMLRPRYRPGWFLPTPAFTETAIAGEDDVNVLDATRMSDGAAVVLKIVATESPDTQISGFLTNEPGAGAYTLPMLDLIPMDDERSFMVMPRMRDCWHPAFETVGEFTEFVQQVLEGLVFLHSKNIAHGSVRFPALNELRTIQIPNSDICTKNMVMDSSRMIPGGFHFVWWTTSDGRHRLRRYIGDDPDAKQCSNECEILRETTCDDSDPHLIKTRTQAGPIKYYYIDFGLSVHFPNDARGLVVGECGRLRKHIPEMSETVPYDPFKVDIRLVGEMLRTEFVVKYDGLEFLIPFIRKLRRHDPAKRPDAAQALALFHDQVSKMSAKKLARPIDKRYSQEVKVPEYPVSGSAILHFLKNQPTESWKDELFTGHAVCVQNLGTGEFSPVPEGAHCKRFKQWQWPETYAIHEVDCRLLAIVFIFLVVAYFEVFQSLSVLSDEGATPPSSCPRSDTDSGRLHARRSQAATPSSNPSAHGNTSPIAPKAPG
ncbi:hypothetical protein B0H13DRAFT_2324187 [Mycena leptocephala]|nr:hypothetical protein B0H13DRAFT_2324187 [Mycena leptocephala]